MSRWLRFAVMIGLLAALFASCDVNSFKAALSRADTASILAGLGLTAVVMTLNTAKWRLLNPKVKFGALLNIVLISQYYSFVVFGQASGEATKAYLLGKTRGRMGGAVASVLADRLTSLIGLLGVGIFGLLLSPPRLSGSIELFLAATLAGVVCLLLMLRSPVVLAWVNKALLWPKISSTYWQSLVGFVRLAVDHWYEFARNLPLVALCIAAGALVHFSNVLVVMVLAHSISINLSFFEWCWIVAVMSLAGLVPISLAGIGVREGALVGLLQLTGTPREASLALSVLIFATNLPVPVTGAILEWRRWKKMPAVEGTT